MRGKASEVSQKMSETIDEQREAAAHALETRQQPFTRVQSHYQGKRSSVAKKPEKIDQTSEYIRRHDKRQQWSMMSHKQSGDIRAEQLSSRSRSAFYWADYSQAIRTDIVAFVFPAQCSIRAGRV